MDLVNDKCESAYRRNSISVSADTIRQWSQSFPPEAEILQIGFEGGAIPQRLIEAGLHLHLVDASGTRLGIFRQMFPEVPSACFEDAACALFTRTFDGVLLCDSTRAMPKPMRVAFLARIERLLLVGGRLLIIIPPEKRSSINLKSEAESARPAKAVYERILCNSGLDILPSRSDLDGYEYVCAVKHVHAGVPL